MALRKWRSVVLHNGGPLAGVQVTVYVAGTTMLASLWEDAAGTTPKANPFVNHPLYGSITFFAEEGTYDILLAKTGYTLEPLYHELVGASALLRHGPFQVTALHGATTLTVPNAIPPGAKDVGVFVRNTVSWGTSLGLTGYAVGDGSLPDIWGGQIGLTAGTTTTQTHFRLPPGTLFYPQGASVVLTAAGGAFDTQGAALVTVVYRLDSVP